jgi:hypothetical protein
LNLTFERIFLERVPGAGEESALVRGSDDAAVSKLALSRAAPSYSSAMSILQHKSILFRQVFFQRALHFLFLHIKVLVRRS